MNEEMILLAAIGTPLAHAVLVRLLSRPPGLRDVIHIGSAGVLAAIVAHLAVNAGSVQGGEAIRVVVARPLPEVELAFKVEPLGVLMAMMVSGLGLLHAIHTSGAVRASQEVAPARMMALIALATSAAMGVAFSANLFTLLLAYQALTLATFPLVAMGDEQEGRRRARTYLATLLVASVGLFLPAMVWTYALTGGIEFQVGGVLAGRVDAATANVLLALFVFGTATTAIPPFHRWLVASCVAPLPALTSIQATLVLPAGGIGLLKISAYVFGAALHDAQWTSRALLVLIALSMCGAALNALAKRDIRERLAYSLLAQSMALALGALLALPAGAFAAALQLLALTCAGATLTMAAANVALATGRTDVGEYVGLGRAMPWTLAAFAIGAASMIGMPPFSGAWAKLWLILAAADANAIWAAVLVAAAAVLTFAHLGPLAANALAGPPPPDPLRRADGASIMLVGPVIVSAAATVGLLMLADSLARFLAPLWAPLS